MAPNLSGAYAVQLTGCYTVKDDGTFVITLQNLVVPGLPTSIPNTFYLEGVLFDC